MNDIGETLAERGKTHGDYSQTAAVAQCIKHALRSVPGWNELTAVQSESLDLIATKMARIVCGDAREIDHWRDVRGYAGLAEGELERG